MSGPTPPEVDGPPPPEVDRAKIAELEKLKRELGKMTAERDALRATVEKLSGAWRTIAKLLG